MIEVTFDDIAFTKATLHIQYFKRAFFSSFKEERTYDEPYTGDLNRRSWLCCPGSQARVECDQPPLLEEVKSPTTPTETITKAPGIIPICSGTCVCIKTNLLLYNIEYIYNMYV